MDWILEILKEFVINKQIKTTEKRINITCEYMIEQGYDSSIGIVLDSLYADSKVIGLLKGE